MGGRLWMMAYLFFFCMCATNQVLYNDSTAWAHFEMKSVVNLKHYKWAHRAVWNSSKMKNLSRQHWTVLYLLLANEFLRHRTEQKLFSPIVELPHYCTADGHFFEITFDLSLVADVAASEQCWEVRCAVVASFLTKYELPLESCFVLMPLIFSAFPCCPSLIQRLEANSCASAKCTLWVWYCKLKIHSCN